MKYEDKNSMKRRYTSSAIRSDNSQQVLESEIQKTNNIKHHLLINYNSNESCRVSYHQKFDNFQFVFDTDNRT